MADDGKALRREIALIGRGRGKRYSAELKTRVVAWAELRRRQGASWPVLSAELGLGLDTVRRWCEASAKPTKRMQALVPVRVVPSRAARTLSVVSPGGFRIDGLSPEEAVALLRAIG